MPTGAAAHGGALWVSTQSYGDASRNITVLTCGTDLPVRCARSTAASGPTSGPGGDLGRFHHAALGTDSLPRFCYADSPAVKIARCTDASCAEFATEVIDADQPSGKSWSDATKCSLADGATVAALSRASGGPLSVVVYSPATKAWSRELTLADYPKTDHPSAALDPNDKGLLAVSFVAVTPNHTNE